MYICLIMKKRKVAPTVGNVLNLFSKHLSAYKISSRRSYQKAFSSLQIFVMSHYELYSLFNKDLIANWVLNNLINGLSWKTITFYLDKISSLYSAIAYKLDTGKTTIFKELKKSLKDLSTTGSEALDLNRFKDKWAFKALAAGVKGEVVKTILKETAIQFPFLNLFSSLNLSDDEKEQTFKFVEKSLKGESPQWFAMRLRPKVKFDDVLRRISLFQKEINNIEIFYPCEEIAKRIGRKVVWKGQPVIRDVVFFKKRQSEIYNMFTKLYDIAWCYRTPGGKPGQYASIPGRAMEDFKKSLGFLTPEYEVAEAGKMDLKPGDKVMIINGDYVDNHATVLKKPSLDADGNKVYRVSLLNNNGHWDIGIDARLLKKI